MAKKNKFKPSQDPKFNQARGRKSGEAGKPSQETKSREKNVGHKKAEEHSIKAKGNRG